MMSDTQEKLKVCSRCGEPKPATTEHFTIDARKRDGLGSACRVCTRMADRKNQARNTAHKRAWREEHPDHARDYSRAQRQQQKQRIAELEAELATARSQWPQGAEAAEQLARGIHEWTHPEIPWDTLESEVRAALIMRIAAVLDRLAADTQP